jgi:predicted permease
MALRAAFQRGAIESEMDKEMRLHLEMQTEENIRQGMSPADARRAAMIAFGGVEQAKEATRDERSTSPIETLGADLRFAVRGMRKQPGFTFAVLTLLALGTGANAAIFSVVDEMIFRPLPFANEERMVQLSATLGGGKIVVMPSVKLVDLWSSRARTVEEFARYQYYSGVLGDTTIGPGTAVVGMMIGSGMLKFTGLRPARGRDFLPGDTLAGAQPVVMLGHALWKRQFGGREDIVGSRVLLDGVSRTVIGVSPPGFFVPFARSSRDVFIPLVSIPGRVGMGAIAKLRPGQTIEDANGELLAFGNIPLPGLDFASDPPRINFPSIRETLRRVLYMLFATVGLVLLIACANVANLLLARAWSRQREFAVRGAMGAGRGRIARQLFTESLLLALAGGLLGFLVAIVLVKILVAFQPDNIGIEGRINATVLGWTLTVSVLTGLLFGIAPALLIGDGRVGEVLKASARAVTGSRATRRLRSGLVVAEVSLSVVLLVGAGLMVRTIAAMQRADVGLETRGMSSISVSMRGNPIYKDSIARFAAWQAIQRRIAATPGIEAATIAMTMPPEFGAGVRPVVVEGRSATGDTLSPTSFNLGHPEFFKVAGIRFIAGRPYTATHSLDEDGGNEVVINERTAKRFWPDGAIGHRIKRGTWATIVGVVPDVDVPGYKGFESGIQMYQPLALAPMRASIVVRSNLPPTLVEPLLRKAVKESGIRASILEFADAESYVFGVREMHRFTLALIGGFAALALLLAAVGLHAVIAYSVSQRLREIGIRIALGAQAGEVAGLVMRQGAVLTAMGVVLGMLAALAAARSMRSMLYGVEPGDPITIAAVGALLLVVSFIASALPARRAVRVDPVEMVRAE